MSTRRTILCAAMPLSGLLLAGSPAAASLPPLQVMRGFVVKAQAIEPTKIGTVPSQVGLLAVREEKATNGHVTRGVIDIVPWQRDCAAMGYPADYLGIVAGETVIDRAAGVRRDIWLSNNCMAPHDPSSDVAIAEAQTSIDYNDAVELLAARQPSVETAAPTQVTSVRTTEPVGDTPADAAIAEAQTSIDYNDAVELLAARQPSVETAALTQGASERTTAPVGDAPPPDFAATRALVTPRLPTIGAVMEETIHQTAELHNTAALVTPRLENLAMNHDPVPGTTDYRPAPPIRAGMALAESSMTMQSWLDEELAQLVFDPSESSPPDEALLRLERLGQMLAVNRLARLTVTAYASLRSERDARAARRLSLSRALAVRDALMLGGAGSEQVRLRALGANVPFGEPDRVDISEN